MKVTTPERPLIIAHRGANSYAPENSLLAFEKALSLGCDGIELDLRICASGHVIVFHDRGLYRMTGVWGAVQTRTLSRLRRFRLMDRADCFIPTLEEVLDMVGDRALINLDLKRESLRTIGLEEATIKTLRNFRLRENIILSSFNPGVVHLLREMAPEFSRGLIYRKRLMRVIEEVPTSDSLHVYHRVLSERYLNLLQSSGFRVFAWTVDRARAMNRLARLGVDGIITNRPELVLQRGRVKRPEFHV